MTDAERVEQGRALLRDFRGRVVPTRREDILAEIKSFVWNMHDVLEGDGLPAAGLYGDPVE